MSEEKNVESTDEDDIILPTEKKEEEKSEEEEPEKEESEEKDESKKEEEEGFVKEGDTVSANKHNQALRKAREAELELAEAKKLIAEGGGKKKKVEREDDDDDFEEDDDEDDDDPKKKTADIEALIDSKVKPLEAKLAERDADDRKKQRSAFFKRYPQYLEDKDKWQEILEEIDTFNPNSKVPYYKQLVKAHKIIAPEDGDGNKSAIEKKKAEMAADSASEKGGSKKVTDRKTTTDELADALGEKMPPGFQYTGKK